VSWLGFTRLISPLLGKCMVMSSQVMFNLMMARPTSREGKEEGIWQGRCGNR